MASPKSIDRKTGACAAASAISDHLDTRTAATELAAELAEQLDGSADLVLLFASFHHRNGLPAASELVRNTLGCGAILAATAESVLGVDVERVGLAGLSAIALRLPGVSVHTFRLEPDDTVLREDQPEVTRALIGYRDDVRALMVLADPFSTPLPHILPLLESCGDGAAIPIGGGVASGASQPGQNMLVQDNFASPHGMVGVSLSGPVVVDFVVSQGCRPIGEPLVVTRVEGNTLRELAGRPAMEVVRDMAEDLDDHEKSLLARGLFIGVVIDEYKERFGRGDFLIRNALGFDHKTGALAIADVVPVGRTVQLHVRDADTADEDLQLLLDAQQLRRDPFACLLVNCNGRGTRLFDHEHHDITAVRRRLGEVPIAGFFAAGEIGPIGQRSFVHGHTAVLAIFREDSPT